MKDKVIDLSFLDDIRKRNEAVKGFTPVELCQRAGVSIEHAAVLIRRLEKMGAVKCEGLVYRVDSMDRMQRKKAYSIINRRMVAEFFDTRPKEK